MNEKCVFEYVGAENMDNGLIRQQIMFEKKEVGYLVMMERDMLPPMVLSYMIPNVSYGMVPSDDVGRDKEGLISMKSFKVYDDAVEYVRSNTDVISFLYKHGEPKSA